MRRHGNAASHSIASAPDPLDGMSLPGWLYYDPEFFEAEKQRLPARGAAGRLP